MISIFLKTAIEFAMVALLIYGFIHEKKLIEFEQLLMRAIVIKYKLYKRDKKLAEMRKSRDFRVVNGGKHTQKTDAHSVYVA